MEKARERYAASLGLFTPEVEALLGKLEERSQRAARRAYRAMGDEPMSGPMVSKAAGYTSDTSAYHGLRHLEKVGLVEHDKMNSRWIRLDGGGNGASAISGILSRSSDERNAAALAAISELHHHTRVAAKKIYDVITEPMHQRDIKKRLGVKFLTYNVLHTMAKLKILKHNKKARTWERA